MGEFAFRRQGVLQVPAVGALEDARLVEVAYEHWAPLGCHLQPAGGAEGRLGAGVTMTSSPRVPPRGARRRPPRVAGRHGSSQTAEVKPQQLPTSPGAARIELDGSDSLTVIRVAGDVDLASQEQLRAAARWATDRDLPVRIDVSEASLLDTSGLQLFSQLAGVERQRGRSITVVGASSRIRTALALTGLDDLVIYEDR
jgi:anti-anti-sigma factor